MIVTADPAEIARIAAEALADGLYRPDGCARFIFAGDGTIERIAYLRGVGWAMMAGYHKMRPRWQVYVDPAHRRQHHCSRLLRAAGYDYGAPAGGAANP